MLEYSLRLQPPLIRSCCYVQNARNSFVQKKVTSSFVSMTTNLKTRRPRKRTSAVNTLEFQDGAWEETEKVEVKTIKRWPFWIGK